MSSPFRDDARALAPGELWLDRTDLVQRYGVHPRTVTEWKRTGVIPMPWTRLHEGRYRHFWLESELASFERSRFFGMTHRELHDWLRANIERNKAAARRGEPKGTSASSNFKQARRSASIRGGVMPAGDVRSVTRARDSECDASVGRLIEPEISSETAAIMRAAGRGTPLDTPAPSVEGSP